MNPSRLSNISYILGIGDGFLRILLFNFLKLDNNLTVLFFFLNESGGFLLRPIRFFNTLIWVKRSTSLQKTALCAWGACYVLSW